MMLKLKLEYFGHLMRRVDSLEKTLMLGGIGGKRRRGRQRMRWLDGITDLMGVGDEQGGLACCDSWGRKELDTTERLNWTELSLIFAKCSPRIYQSLEDSKWKLWVKVTQSCLTLCDPMGYTVHGILQAGILEWIAFPFSRGSSQPRDPSQVSRIAGGFFTNWATGEARRL